METHRTYCRICIALCGMEVTVDEGVITSIRGDTSHPLSRGYLCPKGRALGESTHSPDRLSGAYLGRGDGRRAVSIGEAHEHLGEELRRIVAEHGPESVGVFHGTGAFPDSLGTWAVRKFNKALGSPQTYSTATVDAVAKTLVANEMGGSPLLIPQIDEEVGRLLVFVGINPVVSHGHATMFSNPVERIRAAKARGPVVTLDPRTTETARLSDRHLALQPATDYAVFAHAIRELFARGQIDEARLAERADGAAELRSLVEPFDAALTSRVTGLDAAGLEFFVEAIVAAGRLSILTGTGSTMTPSANLGEWMAWALLVVTDSFDQPGGMWFNPGALSRLDRFDTLPRAAPIAPASPARPDVARCGGEWPSALIPDEIEAGRLRALIVFGGNLPTALPEPARVSAALGAIDVLVAVDVVHNQTTELATHTFACAAQLERPDVISLDPNASARFQHYTDAVLPAGPERPELWRTVARIGAGIGFDVLSGRDATLDPATARPSDVFALFARGDGVERLKEAGGLVVEGGPLYGWVRDRLPLGRWQLAPARLVAQLRALGDLERISVAPLVLTPRRLVRRMNSQIMRSTEENAAVLHPADASRLGLCDGDLVEVSTPTGSISLPLRVTEGIVAGSISVVHGFVDSNVNDLLDRHALDPLSGMAHLAGVAVAIRRV